MREVSGRGTLLPHNAPATLSRARLGGLCCVFLWFLVGGLAHFLLTDSEMRIVPPYVPWPRFVVLVTGVFELAGALGLLVRAVRPVAGGGLFLLTLAVTPANIYMLQHAQDFAVPLWALILRLPVQVALLAVIAWSTDATRLLRR